MPRQPLTSAENRFLQTTLVARLLDVNTQVLANWRHRRIGPPYVRLSHRNVVYRLSDVQDFMAARAVETARMPRPMAGRMPGSPNKRPKPTSPASERS